MHVVDLRPNLPAPRPIDLLKHSTSDCCRVALPGLLVVAVGLACLTGCYRSRLFSPPGNNRDPQLPPTFFGVAPGASTESNSDSIRISQDAAVPETEIQPVPQRLAKARMASGPDDPDGQTASFRQPSSPHEPNQASPRADHQPELQQELQQPESPRATGTSPRISGGVDGVDMQALEDALRDAPPEVRQLAIRRFLAMAQQRATPSPQPDAIEQAMAASLGSLPKLPDEVIDDGRSPTRLASASSDRDQSGPADEEIDSIDKSARPTNQEMVVTQPRQKKAVDAAEDSPQASEETVMRLTDQVSETNGPNVQTVAATRSPAADGATPPVARALLQQPVVAHVDMPASANAATPTDNTEVLSETELFDALLARLDTAAPGETDAEKYRRQIMRRHLMVLAGDPDRAVDQLEGLSSEEQEYLRHQLLGLWTIIDPDGHPVASRRLSSALPQIREATRHLAAASDSLEVRSLEFCTEIEAYGQIKAFPDHNFKKGQEVILYCEIENFLAKSVDGGYETMLRGSYEVLDASGVRITSQTLPVDRQLARNPLRDYFIAYQMHLPRSLDPGSYRLRLTMEDVHGRKYGQADVEFRIAN